MRKLLMFLFFYCFVMTGIAAPVVLDVPVPGGDAIPVLRRTIEQASSYKGRAVLIRLQQGDYHIYRTSSSPCLYYISNTASAEENPDPTKHIGIWLKDMKNITVDGGGARFVTHGEMTPFVIDGCENVTLKNFSLVAADPSVPEMTVVSTDANSITARVTAGSSYEIEDGKFYWKGEGWRFGGGIAQVFYPQTNVTNRCESPLAGVTKAIELDEGLVRFNYDRAPGFKTGEVYQMRHSFRTEACGFIHQSKDVKLENIKFHFLGNFGIVGQYSENLTYEKLYCAPEWGSGRTCAGFADFVQMSGCKGKIRILDSYFEGAHDDPINIHGTHLKVMEYVSDRQVKVRFMHGQSYGFEAFYKGDEVEFVDAHSRRCLQPARVKAVERIDDYEILLTLDRAVNDNVKTAENVSVENVTWTPEVEIRNNYFSRIPTRGILVTTRRKVVIEDNVFYRIPMSGVLVSDDARGWYESGPVRDVTIRRNLFMECGSPVIAMMPENDRYEGAVHRNVRIEANRFVIRQGSEAVSARATDGLIIRDNYISVAGDGSVSPDAFFRTEDCKDVTISGNRCGRSLR
ncbi:right-handed parallel beta-helix repeat-containing protein [Paraprevotella xylaniphila]|uniref:right-handed parallel beta-helix repeat-containing protein n=1 Tax=Paraprevotella xylaniphila TaxID=454155 RepID=UPI003F59070E